MYQLIHKITGLAALLFAVSLSAQAVAAELWVTPSDKNDKEVGNWAVSNTGDVNFVFAAPDNLDSLESVQLVVLGKKTTSVDMHVAVSTAGDGQAHDTNGGSLLLAGVSLSKDEITEVDLSGAFPPLAAGTDYVGVALHTVEAGDVRVLGLRVSYQAVDPLAGMSCPDGEVVTGFGAASELTCVSRGELLAGLGCADGEVLSGFNDVSGAPVCLSRGDLLGGLSCPAGQVANGFAADGSLSCEAIGGGDAGDDGDTGGGGPGPSVTIVIGDAAIIEGNTGGKTMVFTVTLNEAATSVVTVNYATQDGSATAGQDYTATGSSLSFAVGETSKTINVTVLGDFANEGIEYFNVLLSGATNAVIGDGIGLGTIFDDDGGNGR